MRHLNLLLITLLLWPLSAVAQLPESEGGGAAAAHAAQHQDGGADEVATTTPAAGAIPKAGILNTLGVGWIPNLGTGLTGVLPGINGGTNTAFFGAAGPTLPRIYIFPDAAATMLYSGGPLGTPLSGFATNLLGLPLTTGVIGILPGANGGTGSAYFTVAGPLVSRVYTFPNEATTMVGLATTQILTNKTLIDYTNHIHANATHTRVRNDTADDLIKGTPVYITGYNVGLNVVTVDAAKADSATTLPAIGLLEADIAKNATGESLGVGVLLNVKTDHAGWAVGDKLWISTATAGTLTKTRPTGAANFVQRMGIVLRRHASLGIIEVVGAHKRNSLPLNIDASLILSGTLPLARLDADLAALAALASTGLVARTGAATYSERTVTGTADEIDVANGDGVAGNPTLSLAAAVGKWIKYPVPYTAPEFEAADTDAAVDLFTLPANGIIEAIRIKHSVAFTGAGVTSVVCSVGDGAGDTGNSDAYMPGFNVFQAVGATVADYDGGAYSTTAASQSVQLHCSCNVNFGDGAGTTALSAGSVDVSIKWAVLP